MRVALITIMIIIIVLLTGCATTHKGVVKYRAAESYRCEAYYLEHEQRGETRTDYLVPPESIILEDFVNKTVKIKGVLEIRDYGRVSRQCLIQQRELTINTIKVLE